MLPVLVLAEVTGPSPLVITLSVAGFVIALLVGMRLLDRARVRSDIRARGAEPIEIRHVWDRVRGARGARRYAVRYREEDGRLVSAECLTNVSIGVEWEHRSPVLKRGAPVQPSSLPTHDTESGGVTGTGDEGR